ncbi:hypothetical protein HELRODRAFT_163296 [Helobdella robusta]|uniref:Uncharacterized protein n=1 Tax=Helobdella robusta TaxID=6412 RepID=T1ETV5_HELRO|nr:hypothetical protein HELRODRAFT_163296 [Helobdella robusta]ESN96250.1 hypothetical protein HELRODRAFT_163296 [Helobdella robusta]
MAEFEENASAIQERMKLNNFLTRKENIKHGTSIRRMDHILKTNNILTFMWTWVDMLFSVTLFPFTFLFVCILLPCVRLCTCGLNAIVRFYHYVKTNDPKTHSMEKMTGNEFFWLAPSDNERTHFLNVRISSNTVVAITIQMVQKASDPILNYETFKEILLERVVYFMKEDSNKHVFPRFTMRIRNLPFGKMWIKANNFNINDHVFEVF